MRSDIVCRMVVIFVKFAFFASTRPRTVRAFAPVPSLPTRTLVQWMSSSSNVNEKTEEEKAEQKAIREARK